MPLVADLHIHSHYSRATSKDLTLEHLARWAQLKGVHVVGTGDISHPGWLEEMRTRLEPAEDGLFQLKPEYAAAVAQQTPAACRNPVRFLLAGEISNIYKRHGATRKVHNLVFVPSLEAVEQLQRRLERIGNIRADGRPILGLDSHDLLEIVLDLGDRCHLIPAHIWTPWFSMLGSKSGFDSVEECFGDLTPHIFALETGLSSDPPMNWRVGNLDRYTLISNSDAHSPQKLAREATLFRCELAYDALFEALRTGDPEQLGGTVEFFPEEGKYHLDGHRACGICWEPPTTIAHHGLCPVCGREITVGVMHRIEILADRPPGTRGSRAAPYHSLVPLPEVLSEVHGTGAGSRRVQAEYEKLLAALGPELTVLVDAPLEEIAAAGGPRLAEGIRRMRAGEVVAEGGYDGEYGVIRLFAGAGLLAGTPQIDLFDAAAPMPTKRSANAVNSTQAANGIPAARPAETPAVLAEAQPAYAGAEPAGGDPGWVQDGLFATPAALDPAPPDPTLAWLAQLNDDQRAAVLHAGGPLLVIAGPGTGKTRTLAVRLAYQLRHGQVTPDQVLAITFTNKAATEMAERLAGLVGPAVAERLHVKTFHAFGLWLLQHYGDRLGLPPNPVIVDDEERALLLRRAWPKLSATALAWALDAISAAKNRLLDPDAPELANAQHDGLALAPIYAGYQAVLTVAQAFDFDDLILRSVRLLETQPEALTAVHARFAWIAVDEYQDVNLAQHRLLQLLASGGAALSVIGDPDQAIYGFRGADRRFILRFAEDYPGTTVLRLTRSYRTPQTLLDAATQVLATPGADAGPTAGLRLWSEFTAEVKIDVHPAPTDKAEAEFVVHQIEQLVGGTSYFSLDSGRATGLDPQARRSFGDFAVLFRLNAQARPLIEAFERSGIPYQFVGQNLFELRPVRELLACLWLRYNPRSRLHLDRLLSAGRSTPPPRYLEGVAAIVAAADYRLGDAFEAAAIDHTFSAAQRVRLAALARAWRTFAAGSDDLPVTQLLERSRQLLAVLRDDAGAPLPDWWQPLLLRAVPYGRDLAAFLAATALAGSGDEYDPRADRVPLLTLHAAKGLEFPVVLIVGCETGLLPYSPEARPGDGDENEERRLLYVGITRARERLWLSYARSRTLYGRATNPAPSPFLNDISAVLKQVQEAALPRRARPDNVQLDLFA